MQFFFPFLFPTYCCSACPFIVTPLISCCNYYFFALFNVVFNSSNWCIHAIFNAGESSTSFFFWHITSMSSLGYLVHHDHQRFLVHLSFSRVHFKNDLKYLTKGNLQVFIPLIIFLVQNLVSSSFLIRLKYSFLIVFFHPRLFDGVHFQYSRLLVSFLFSKRLASSIPSVTLSFLILSLLLLLFVEVEVDLFPFLLHASFFFLLLLLLLLFKVEIVVVINFFLFLFNFSSCCLSFFLSFVSSSSSSSSSSSYYYYYYYYYYYLISLTTLVSFVPVLKIPVL